MFSTGLPGTSTLGYFRKEVDKARSPCLKTGKLKFSKNRLSTTCFPFYYTWMLPFSVLLFSYLKSNYNNSQSSTSSLYFITRKQLNVKKITAKILFGAKQDLGLNTILSIVSPHNFLSFILCKRGKYHLPHWVIHGLNGAIHVNYHILYLLLVAD